MNRRIVTVVSIVIVLFVALGLNVDHAFAAVTGRLTKLSFAGASAKSCGVPTATGGSVTTTVKVSDIATVYDGNGTIVFFFSGTFFGTFNNTTTPFKKQPQKNPIHMVEVLGGVTVVDLTADDPCLPPSGHPASVLTCFTDGRVNCDAAQRAAIYCTADGFDIYSVTNSVGTLALRVTKKEIDAVPANPDKNTLIKQANGIALYRLHGGKLQVNGPDGYVFIWDGGC